MRVARINVAMDNQKRLVCFPGWFSKELEEYSQEEYSGYNSSQTRFKAFYPDEASKLIDDKGEDVCQDCLISYNSQGPFGRAGFAVDRTDSCKTGSTEKVEDQQ